MCGFAGFLNRSADQSGEAMTQLVRRMADTLIHRGPDDAGTWVDAAAGIALSHRRLAVLDLSPAGHQPMRSADQRFVLTYNGEIYNHLELRSRLEAAGASPAGGWRGHSDTETLLAAVVTWGVEATLSQLVGMFAFALWDSQVRELWLARDRFGEKPLYYGWQGGSLLFGSELKALRPHPAFGDAIDREALALLLRFNAIPAPHSIYQGISKLPPGCFVRIRPDSTELTPVAYWSARLAAERAMAAPFAGSERDAIDQLDALLRGIVADQMLSDVPLGAFLSGGVDSSAVVALMQAQAPRPVHTFTIGFGETQYNEAPFAREVARHLGTQHTELYVTPADALAVIPRLPTLYDEPFSDASQIPTFLVSQLARTGVTVSLSGDGGDELFGGYTRYLWATQIWDLLRHLPPPIRRAGSALLTAASPAQWDDIYHRLSPLLPRRLRQMTLGDKLHKVARVFGAAEADAVYLELLSHWSEPQRVVTGLNAEPTNLLTGPAGSRPNWRGFAERMMYYDTMGYLPDDILMKVDRAAMGVSLETRVPFLDHRLYEFVWSLPLAMRIRGKQGKWILRQVLDRYVPRQLIERPKMGFGVPIDAWLRGPLKDWAAQLLDPARLHREGFLDPEPIQALWREHQSGARNRAYHLWDVLMFQAWLEARGQ